MTNQSITELKCKHQLESISVQDQTTKETKEWKYDGVFVFIGLTPNHDLVKDKVELDPAGFVVTGNTLMTSLSGVFAAGDVRSGSTKQAAAGEGATAALMIREYVSPHSL